MKLHAPELERIVRHRIRQRLHKRPDLSKQRRAASSAARRRQTFGRLVPPLMAPWIAGLGVLACYQAPDGLLLGLGWLAFLLFIWTLLRAEALTSLLHESSDVQALALLPVHDHVVFRWSIDRWLIGGWPLPVQMLVGIGVLGILFGFTAGQWALALLLTLLQCGLSLWIASWLSARSWIIPVWPPLLFVGFVLWITGQAAEAAGWSGFAPLLLDLLRYIVHVPPFGWVWWGFHEITFLGRLPGASLLVLPFLTVPLCWPRIRRLANSYAVPHEAAIARRHLAQLDQQHPVILGETSDPPSDSERERASHATQSMVHPLVTPQHGLLNRLIYRRPTDREQCLIECAAGAPPDYSARWTSRVRFLAVGLLVAASVQMLNSGGPAGVYLAWTICVIGGLALLPVVASLDGLATGHATGTSQIPQFALLPVNLRDLLRLELRLSIPRAVAAALPLSGALGVLWFLRGDAWTTGVRHALSLVALSILSRPLAVALSVTSVTDDTRSVGARGAVMLLAIAFLVLLFMGAGAMMLFAPFWPGWCLGFLLATTASSSLFLHYHRAWRRQRFGMTIVEQDT